MTIEHFLLAGAQRSGTTFLYHLLDQHPEIEMARPLRPEPKFFLRPSPDLEDYRQLFAGKPGAHVLGEKSTSYIEHPGVARKALSLLAGLRVIFLLRDPVERAISNYRFSVENGIETAPFDDAILHEEARRGDYDRARFSVSPFAYVARGRYEDFIRGWEEIVGRDRIRIVVLEQLIADPGVLEGLYQWLGVDPSFRPALPPERLNESTGAVDVSAAARRHLTECFQESNRRLQERYGVDISFWQR